SCEQPTKMMGAATRLHADYASRQFCHQIDQRVPPAAAGLRRRTRPNRQHSIRSCRDRCQALQSSWTSPPFESPTRLSRRKGGAGHFIKFPARLDEVAREKAVDVREIEIWFADEARIGQKNKITRRWAKRGTRPSAPRAQRTASTYIFGAICPKQGKGAALILPACNTEAMNLHLAEIAKAVAPGAH